MRNLAVMPVYTEEGEVSVDVSSSISFSNATDGFAVLLADADASLAEIGRATEKLLGEKTGAQFVPFGLAKIYAYLSAVLAEAKNLRIIFALRAAHADRDTILQNIRV
jgi:hypothetical protein